eukprot:585794-Rhodomonas_salina.4
MQVRNTTTIVRKLFTKGEKRKQGIRLCAGEVQRELRQRAIARRSWRQRAKADKESGKVAKNRAKVDHQKKQKKPGRHQTARWRGSERAA